LKSSMVGVWHALSMLSAPAAVKARLKLLIRIKSSPLLWHPPRRSLLLAGGFARGRHV
jgi:hypothetical protein